jgi:ketosteroid isomerase-like protein
MATKADLAARGRDWIAAWNARDLERILALYDELCVMVSPNIVGEGLDLSGVLRGKAALRAYWRVALERQPDLRFDLLDVYASPDSVVLRYRNQNGREVCEFLRYDPTGLIVQAAANHQLP